MRWIVSIGCVVVIVVSGFGPTAWAGEEEQIQAKLQALQKQREALVKQEQELVKQEQSYQAQLKEIHRKQGGSIKVEVTGILRFEPGRGYFLAVRSASEPDRESRVWLRISEQKTLVRKLEGLTGKKVVARGELAQMPADVHASVPPLGMYLDKFTIELEGEDSK